MKEVIFIYKHRIYKVIQNIKFGFILFASLLFLLLTQSCESDTYLDIGKESNNLVLFSFPQTDSAFTIHASYSVPNNSFDDFERLYDGNIKIIKNGELVDSFQWPYKLTWSERNITVKEGDIFEIELSNQTTKAYGVTTIPFANKLISVKSDSSKTNNEYHNCIVTFENSEETDNYYQLIITEESWVENDNRTLYDFKFVNYKKDDKLFNIKDNEGLILGGIDFEGTFSDYLINKSLYPLEIRVPSIYFSEAKNNEKRVLTFHLLTLSKDYYDYVRSRIIFDYNQKIPIVTPLVKIHNNIIGGLGLVGGVAASSHSITFIGKDYNK